MARLTCKQAAEVLEAIGDRDFKLAHLLLMKYIERPFTKTHGLCNNVFNKCYSSTDDHIFYNILPKWEHYTNRPSFPVPNPDEDSTKTEADIYFAYEADMGLYVEDEYCNLRCDLAKFVAAHLRKSEGLL